MAEESGKPIEVVCGFIERIVFENEVTGYGVLRMESPPPSDNTFTAVGTLAGLNEGLFLELHGRWVMNRKFGEQFETDYYKITYPESKEGVAKYLSSGLIPGVGKRYAGRILESLGERALDIIESDPTKLYEVPGIGKKRANAIAVALKKHSDARRILVALMEYGITPKKAQKIIRFYGEKAAEVLRLDPYRLAEDIPGIGFLTADKIAGKIGVPPDSLQRARAGVIYAAFRRGDEGHTSIEREELLKAAEELLETSPERCEEGLKRALLDGNLIEKRFDDGKRIIYLRRLFNAEKIVAEKISTLIKSPPLKPNKEKLLKTLDEFEKRNRFQLTEKQKEAVLNTFSQTVAVITGGPGTGKTTIIKAVVELANSESNAVRLAAPTGRAAKRLSESANHPASTIHRLLEYNPHLNRYSRDETSPIEADLVIVDEASMIDLELFSALLRALNDKTRLLLVGDVDQLPSVGPGRVLADIIDIGYVSVTRLDTIFRQEEGGSIVVNAHRIKNGEMPIIARSEEKEGEFYFIERNDAPATADLVVQMATERIPARFGFNPFDQIQPLSPMRKGETGVENLNEILQARLNPAGEGLARGRYTFRVGDKVMQTVNDYGREVFNGDVGRIIEMNREEGSLVVDFTGRNVVYERDELEGLELAYAMTIHKSQGSEYEAVVIPLLLSHYVLLKRDLFYTAVTRAKKLAVIIGQKRALWLAVSKKGSEYRASRLADHILELLRKVGIK
ncbi:MAG: ATP-dependent RecD-like DNA helicase [Myxococcota bacterium]